MVRALTAITVVRLNRTHKNISETKLIMQNIVNSVNTVFQLYPSFDPVYLKKLREYIKNRKQKTQMKTILVFIASEQDLYGDLIWNIGQLFISEFKKGTDDAVVIGKIGRSILAKEGVGSDRVQYFDLNDDKPDLKVIERIIEIVLTYERIIIFHGESESLLRQKPVKSELFTDVPQLVKFSKRYLFEPDPEEIFNFLHNKKSSLSLHQKVYEAQYARLAAKRWNWTKQQMARARLLEELRGDYLRFRRNEEQKQHQVSIFAHRQNIIDDPNIKNTNVYGR